MFLTSTSHIFIYLYLHMHLRKPSFSWILKFILSVNQHCKGMGGRMGGWYYCGLHVICIKSRQYSLEVWIAKFLEQRVVGILEGTYVEHGSLKVPQLFQVCVCLFTHCCTWELLANNGYRFILIGCKDSGYLLYGCSGRDSGDERSDCGERSGYGQHYVCYILLQQQQNGRGKTTFLLKLHS